MSVDCSILLDHDYFKKISLVAGESGINRKITWPFICTTQTISQWVHGGELLFVSGSGINTSENNLLLLMEESIESKVSGMVLLTGEPYIVDIPLSLIKLADAQSFPLFKMPWTLRLLDVTQKISQIIMEDINESQKLSQLFEQLLFSDTHSQNFEGLLQNAGINPRPFQFIALFGINSEDKHDSDIIKRNFIQTLEIYSPEQSSDIITVSYYNTVICLALSDDFNSISKVENCIVKVFAMMEKQYSDIKLQLGFGRVCKDGFDIQQSYIEAKNVLSLIQRDVFLNNIQRYENLGIYRLLFEIEDTDKIKEYCMDTVGKIADEDKKNNSELLKTLYVYLKNNCNLLKTSEDLFIHRNTVTYRLNSISNIIDKNLQDPYVRLELFTSIIAGDFLKSVGISSSSLYKTEYYKMK